MASHLKRLRCALNKLAPPHMAQEATQARHLAPRMNPLSLNMATAHVHAQTCLLAHP
jgi:hypothetical protein